MAREIIIEFGSIVHGLPNIVLGRRKAIVPLIMVGEMRILAVEIFAEHRGVDCSGGSGNSEAAGGGRWRWLGG